MPIMRNTVHRPGTADPVAGATVQIRLVASTSDPSAPGYLSDAKVTVLGRWRAETDEAGAWERDLPATSSITPAGTVYELVELDGMPAARSTPRHFTVPDGPGPHWVGDHLTLAPGALPALHNHEDEDIDGGSPDTVFLLPDDDIDGGEV